MLATDGPTSSLIILPAGGAHTIIGIGTPLKCLFCAVTSTLASEPTPMTRIIVNVGALSGTVGDILGGVC